MTERNQIHFFVASLAALLAVFALGAWIFSATNRQEAERLAVNSMATFNRVGVPGLGPMTARVQITEFFDPACEGCRAFYPHVKSLLAQYEGRVRLNLRYAAFHDGSEYVIKALEAVRLQGHELYWRALEALLAAQSEWADHGRPEPERIWTFLSGVGVDVERARREMNDSAIVERLRQDAADITALNVRQTPSFFINGQPLRNFGPEGLAAQVMEALAAVP